MRKTKRLPYFKLRYSISGGPPLCIMDKLTNQRVIYNLMKEADFRLLGLIEIDKAQRYVNLLNEEYKSYHINVIEYVRSLS